MMLKALFDHPLGVAREMDRLFDSMVSSQPLGLVSTARPPWPRPAINIWEDQDHLYAESELPGMAMDDLEVFVSDDELTIRGTRTIDLPEDARALRQERAAGSFERTIGLPCAIDTEKVEAKLCNGVLSINLPKAETARPRKIVVEALPQST